MTREQWDEIHNVLRTNGWSAQHSNLGPGIAILQGLLRCERHNRSMQPHYSKHGSRSYGYRCRGDYDAGGPGARQLQGHYLDRSVVSALLQRLTPPEIQLLREAWRAARADDEAEHRRQDYERRRRQRVVEDLEAKFFDVDPDNSRVAKLIERRLEQAKLELEVLETAKPSQQDLGTIFSEDGFAELLTLAADLQGIWDAPTTTVHDRKELVRIFVYRVVVDCMSQQQALVKIAWTDGHPDTLLPIVLPAGRSKLVSDLVAAGLTAERLGVELAARGALPPRADTWDEATTKSLLYRTRDSAPQQQTPLFQDPRTRRSRRRASSA